MGGLGKPITLGMCGEGQHERVSDLGYDPSAGVPSTDEIRGIGKEDTLPKPGI